ncbi:MAG TPA: hypothetical protein VHY09_00740 [Candidatus Methylacidiphilales bacterium]|jgi:hypothetical protein|nr:hypothetical protein [Candidatus Methylacidiphilales bacterium]
MNGFVQLFFFVGTILSALKPGERFLNVSIYVLISMTVSALAFHFYFPAFEGFYSASALFEFWAAALLVFSVRVWQIWRRTIKSPLQGSPPI